LAQHLTLTTLLSCTITITQSPSLQRWTTWLGDNFDSVLLYGSLVEAYTYMKGEQDMMALYNGKYQEALALAKRLGDGMERQDAYRSGQYRQAVT
jgi:CTP:phosphocholine cytidylyltransferase-like protein